MSLAICQALGAGIRHSRFVRLGHPQLAARPCILLAALRQGIDEDAGDAGGVAGGIGRVEALGGEFAHDRGGVFDLFTCLRLHVAGYLRRQNRYVLADLDLQRRGAEIRHHGLGYGDMHRREADLAGDLHIVLRGQPDRLSGRGSGDQGHAGAGGKRIVLAGERRRACFLQAESAEMRTAFRTGAAQGRGGAIAGDDAEDLRRGFGGTDGERQPEREGGGGQ